MNKKLRITKSHLEVQKILAQLKPSIEVMLWQTKDEQRTLYNGVLIKIEPAQFLLAIQLKDSNPQLKINDDCYLKFITHDGVSKCKITGIKENTVILELREEMVLHERRREWRAHFNKDDVKTVLIGYEEKKERCDVHNASPNGLAIQFNKSLFESFSKGKKFKILQLGSKALDIPIEAAIAHKSDLNLGIKLDTAFPKELFDEFIYVERPVPVDVKKFYSDLEFQNTVKSNMKMVASKLQKKPKLAAALRLLNIDRESTSYIKNHIELLCEITCSVGKTLGWVTEGTIEKLIYVSYVHDIRYFEHPHLARLKSIEDFNDRDYLTKEEKQMYLEGPTYAAGIAKEEEDSSSADIEKILIQQKEKSDGSGFPNGIKSIQMLPLSCLFILCHEFVDYVLTEPKWTIHDFVRLSRSTFKGPYFAKIFQVFESMDTK